LVSTPVNNSATGALTSESAIPFLPFRLQYRIFTGLQAILESCCFNFAQKNYPGYLIRKGWDCREAGELTAWTRGLTREFYSNPVFDMGEEEFELILKKGGEIRHAAVHRVPVSAEKIQRLIEDARAMAEVLDERERMGEIDQIKVVVDKHVASLLERRRAKDEKLRLELEELERLKRDIELRETRAAEAAEVEEEMIIRRFRDDIGRELEWLTPEGKGFVLKDRNDRGGNEGEGAAAGAQAERLQLATINEQDEEAFHDSEVWPASEFTAADLEAAAESISTLSA
jgi:hypothetical protein